MTNSETKNITAGNNRKQQRTEKTRTHNRKHKHGKIKKQTGRNIKDNAKTEPKQKT